MVMVTIIVILVIGVCIVRWKQQKLCRERANSHSTTAMVQ